MSSALMPLPSNIEPGTSTSRVSGPIPFVTAGRRFTRAAPVDPSPKSPSTADGKSSVTLTASWSSVGCVSSGVSTFSTFSPPAVSSLSVHALRPRIIGRAMSQRNLKVFLIICLVFELLSYKLESYTCFVGIKNNAASLAGKQEKPYNSAREPAYIRGQPRL